MGTNNQTGYSELPLQAVLEVLRQPQSAVWARANETLSNEDRRSLGAKIRRIAPVSRRTALRRAVAIAIWRGFDLLDPRSATTQQPHSVFTGRVDNHSRERDSTWEMPAQTYKYDHASIATLDDRWQR